MASRQVATHVADALLPSTVGHAFSGSASPDVAPDAIEAFAPRVAAALRSTRKTGRERGFLAYAPATPGAPFVAEPDSTGGAADIRWHWQHPQAAVAFSFHTHPGARALCAPSGIDAVGALVRGEHVTYVLTMDGRLSGWRFREKAHAWAVDDAMSALDASGRLKRGLVDFLYDAFDAMRPTLMAPVYAARIDEAGAVARAAPDASFFAADEWG